MRQDLRKGQSSIYCQYESGSGDTIGVKCAEVELIENVAVIRFELKPVDENERIDARKLDEDKLSSINIDDDYIIENLERFLNQPYVTANELGLEIIYKSKKYSYKTLIGTTGLGFLPLMVEAQVN